MSDVYETEYGIFNHFSPIAAHRPLASVALHACEDLNTGSLLERTIRMYAKKGIKETFGLNLEEFLRLPMDIAELLIAISDEERSAKSQGIHEIEQSLKV